MSVEDKYEFLKVENARLQKENYELKSHMEGLKDGFHEVVAGLKEELIQTTNDLNTQIRENLGFVDRLAIQSVKLEEEKVKVHLLCNKIEDLKSCLTQTKMEEKG